MIIFDKLFRYLTRSKAWALLTQAFPPIKPSAICIGAQKGGTTALYNYLKYHPSIAPARFYEIDFFNCDARFSRGISFYHSHFPRNILANKGKLSLDITPGYIVDADKTAKRIYDYNPNMKIIVLLRNPIARAYSAWQMYRKFCTSDRDWFSKWVGKCDYTVQQQDFFLKRPSSFGQNFEKDITDEIEAIKNGQNIEMPILRLGLYHQYLKYYFDYFPKDQILVISSEDMKKNTKEQLQLIETFIGLDPYSWSEEELLPTSEGKYKDSMSQSEYMLLKSFYQDPNTALFDLLQKKFSWD